MCTHQSVLMQLGVLVKSLVYGETYTEIALKMISALCENGLRVLDCNVVKQLGIWRNIHRNSVIKWR